MRDGFLKIAAGVPKIAPCDPARNAGEIKSLIGRARAAGTKILVLPELAVSGADCGSLFGFDSLTAASERALSEIMASTRGDDMLVVLGLPVRYGGAVYSCAAAIQRGRLLALVPKTRAGEHFAAGGALDTEIEFAGHRVPLTSRLLLRCRDVDGLSLGIEVGDDFLAPVPPSATLALAGATLILNPCAEPDIAGRRRTRRDTAAALSARLMCGYVRSNAGYGESTARSVYTGQCIIAENGEILAEDTVGTGLLLSEPDISALTHARIRSGAFSGVPGGMREVFFTLDMTTTELTRKIRREPFVPGDEKARCERCEEILNLQSLGLRRRMEHVGSKKLVLGLSGGLDSSLAALVCARATDALALPRDATLALSMPCFGTTGRTRSNAQILAGALGFEFREIDITEAVRVHFRDIGHDEKNRNAAFENAQARERTQVLMDVANDVNGIVIGTGDLSELALGWATYGGDLMSMYGVNASVPKTLVRAITAYTRDGASGNLKAALGDILDTPVSPELLPPEGGEIGQKTEDILGPYELHDFFLWHMLRRGASPGKLLRLALYAFRGTYDSQAVEKWLRLFLSRLVSQQFKRNPMPDGPAIGSVSLSPQGGFALPSDAAAQLLISDLDAGGIVSQFRGF